MRLAIPRIGKTSRLLPCLVVLLLVRAAVATAGIPSPPNCTVDHVIIGSYGPQGATSGDGPCSATALPGFDVYVRDFNNVPVAGSVVSIVFAGTGTSVRPYLNQWPQPGVSVVCMNHQLNVTTDVNGHARFVPRFGRYGEGPAVPVYADGVFLRNIEARSADYNCDGQVNVADLGTFSGDYLDPVGFRRRSDFDDCPGMTIADLSFFAAQYLASAAGPIEPVCP
jgi:hypothetical protein